MQFAAGLECVVHGDEERTLPDGLQDLSLRLCVLRRLPLLHDGCLLQDLHGVQLALVAAVRLPGQKDFAVSWKIKLRKKMFKT